MYNERNESKRRRFQLPFGAGGEPRLRTEPPYSNHDTDTVKLTIETLVSHRVTRKFKISTNSLQTPYERAESDS
eukprot:7502532-Pyramimonas_sp.AAC.1